MPLTDADAGEAYAGLSQVLTRSGLDWITIQVEERLALGKLAPRKIKARGGTDEAVGENWALGARRTEPARSATFVVAEPYSAQERLDALVEATLLAVPKLREVAIQALDGMAAFGVEGRLAFEPEANVREPYEISRAGLAGRENANLQLVSLLNELRGGPAHAAQTLPSS